MTNPLDTNNQENNQHSNQDSNKNDKESFAAKKEQGSIKSAFKNFGITIASLAALWILLNYVLAPLVLGTEENVDNSQAINTKNTKNEMPKEAEAKETVADSSFPAIYIDIALLEERIAELEENVDNITFDIEANNKENINNSEKYDNNTIEKMAREISELKAELDKVRNYEHDALRSMIIVSQIKEAMRSGRAFASEIEELALLRPDMKEILKTADSYSITGISTIDSLKREFADNIAALFVKNDEKTIAGNLKSIIKIRKVGKDHHGSDDDAVIARAESLLAEGNIAAALQESEKLSAATKKIFANWQEQAKTHLAANLLLKKITLHLGQKPQGADSKNPQHETTQNDQKVAL